MKMRTTLQQKAVMDWLRTYAMNKLEHIANSGKNTGTICVDYNVIDFRLTHVNRQNRVGLEWTHEYLM